MPRREPFTLSLFHFDGMAARRSFFVNVQYFGVRENQLRADYERPHFGYR